jgi:hypothetical protein
LFFFAVGLFYLAKFLRKNENENEEGKEMNDQQE